MGMGQNRLLLSICGALCALVSVPAAAQNSLVGNVRSDDVFDGITTEQLKSIFGATKFNDDNFTIVERQIPNGGTYLALSAPTLPFTLLVSGIGETYSGKGDGIYAGIALFTTVNLNSFSQSEINEFNMRHKFVKLIPEESGSVLAVEFAAAGGVTKTAVVLALIPFFGGIEGLLDMAEMQTVNYKPDSKTPHIPAALQGQNIVFTGGTSAQLELLTIGHDDMRSQRLIENFASALSDK